eukprot:1110780-Pelagomonas_calceolata.AAC.1
MLPQQEALEKLKEEGGAEGAAAEDGEKKKKKKDKVCGGGGAQGNCAIERWRVVDKLESQAIPGPAPMIQQHVGPLFAVCQSVSQSVSQCDWLRKRDDLQRGLAANERPVACRQRPCSCLFELGSCVCVCVENAGIRAWNGP